MKTVLAVAIVKRGAILLLRRRDPYTWMIPEGEAREKESDIACLRRALWDQIPCSVFGCMVPLGIWYSVTTNTNNTNEPIQFHVYTGDYMGSSGGYVIPSREFCDARWVSGDQVFSFALTDATRQVIETLRFTGRL